MTGLRLGDRGAPVAEVRARLTALNLLPTGAPVAPGASGAADSDVFDAAVDRAVRTFQQDRGITVDGVVGPMTLRRMDDARWLLGDRVLSYTAGHVMTGDDVADLQQRLTTLGFATGRIDAFDVEIPGAGRP